METICGRRADAQMQINFRRRREAKGLLAGAGFHDGGCHEGDCTKSLSSRPPVLGIQFLFRPITRNENVKVATYRNVVGERISFWECECNENIAMKKRWISSEFEKVRGGEKVSPAQGLGGFGLA